MCMQFSRTCEFGRGGWVFHVVQDTLWAVPFPGPAGDSQASAGRGRNTDTHTRLACILLESGKKKDI